MKSVAACLVAVCVSVVASVILAFAVGVLIPAVAPWSLGLGIAAGFLLLREPSAETGSRVRDLDPWEWVVIVCFALFSLRAFLWLAFTNGDEIKFISTNNLGDLSLHLTYINYLANGAPFWPENPIFAGVKLHYPLGVDLFNSLLVLSGMDVYRSLVWVGLVASLLTGVALYRWGGAFTLAGFLFNGGLIGFKFLRTLHFADYQDEVAWKSIPLALFVTQRGLLYAIPAGLLLLWSWRRKFFPDDNDGAKWNLPAWAEVLLYASMPLFHLHTFIFLSLLLAYWLVTESKLRKKISVLLACAFVPGTVAVTLVTGLMQSKSAIWWLPGWMQGDENFFVFWFTNFGILPLLVGWLCVGLIRRRDDDSSRVAGAFVFPALLVFLLACFVMFAKWEWDNTKLMIWSYLVILPWLWSRLVERQSFPVRCVLCVALFFSGFVSLVGGIDGTHGGYALAKRSELDSITGPVRDIPLSETFATFPTYNHPLLLLGRKVVAGYEGHLSSHGIDYGQQVASLKSLMMGEPDWEKNARSLGARYLFWGEREREEYKESREPWKRDRNVIAQGTWGEIYDLESVAATH
jgi:hypothetical protein